METNTEDATTSDLGESERVNRAAIEFNLTPEAIRLLDEGLEDCRRDPLGGIPWSEAMRDLLAHT